MFFEGKASGNCSYPVRSLYILGDIQKFICFNSTDSITYNDLMLRYNSLPNYDMRFIVSDSRHSETSSEVVKLNSVNMPVGTIFKLPPTTTKTKYGQYLS